MFFSSNPNVFKTPNKCILDNGTSIYYQSEALDCSCLAPIRADPDFAGAAVITSFLFIGWLTIAVAAVPTGRSLWITWLRTTGPWRLWKWLVEIVQFEPNDPWQRRTSIIGFPARAGKSDEIRRIDHHRDSSITNVNDSESSDSGSESKQPLPSSRRYINLDPEPAYCTFSRRIVLQLCDLQIIMGIATLVSALAQYDRLTFYHAQFAEQFWWVTLDSFWISRIDYSQNTPEMNTWRAHLRRTAIWVSVALSVVVQSIVTYREHSLWDATIPGRCYQADGPGTGFGQNLFWLAGTAIYFVVMTFSMTRKSRAWFDSNINAKIEPSIQTMYRWVVESKSKTTTYKLSSAGTSPLKRYPTLLFLYAKVASYSLAYATWWIFVLFISIWCAGNSAAAVELVVYSIFAGFLTWWILFLKIQNRPLIRGDEDRMTYAQTLSLFLFILCAFQALDVWVGVKRDERRALRHGKRPVDEEHTVAPELAVDFASPEVRDRMDGTMPDNTLSPRTVSPTNAVPGGERDLQEGGDSIKDRS
ncbi:hypothetical protein BT63DRAFT_439643 [Microthyrium microscopicum]|uniref:Uncharacterized protein n=1 Tax=Microthyrium microscopicum TaxID=703497 RepID=A0A6A6UHT6_9PEZI|nr:hypothetical protein BT63DRAFT_439643 [Microthyrium microscopicum]